MMVLKRPASARDKTKHKTYEKQMPAPSDVATLQGSSQLKRALELLRLAEHLCSARRMMLSYWPLPDASPESHKKLPRLGRLRFWACMFCPECCILFEWQAYQII